MKRFLVFTGDTYYPGGGWSDFSGSFDTLDEAKKGAVAKMHLDHEDWAHVVDSEDSKVVWETR